MQKSFSIARVVSVCFCFSLRTSPPSQREKSIVALRITRRPSRCKPRSTSPSRRSSSSNGVCCRSCGTAGCHGRSTPPAALLGKRGSGLSGGGRGTSPHSQQGRPSPAPAPVVFRWRGLQACCDRIANFLRDLQELIDGLVEIGTLVFQKFYGNTCLRQDQLASVGLPA